MALRAGGLAWVKGVDKIGEFPQKDAEAPEDEENRLPHLQHNAKVNAHAEEAREDRTCTPDHAGKDALGLVLAQ